MLMKVQTVSEFIKSWISENDTVKLIDRDSNTEIDVFQASELLDNDYSDCLVTCAKIRYHIELTIIDDTHPYEDDSIWCHEEYLEELKQR